MVQIAAGAAFTCARTQLGKVLCWGNGADLGASGVTDSGTASYVPGITDANGLFAGAMGACAIRSLDGSVAVLG